MPIGDRQNNTAYRMFDTIRAGCWKKRDKLWHPAIVFKNVKYRSKPDEIRILGSFVWFCGRVEFTREHRRNCDMFRPEIVNYNNVHTGVSILLEINNTWSSSTSSTNICSVEFNANNTAMYRSVMWRHWANLDPWN